MQDNEFTDDGPDEPGAQKEREYTVYVTVTYSGFCTVTASSADAARAIVNDGDFGEDGLHIDHRSPDDVDIDSVSEN